MYKLLDKGVYACTECDKVLKTEKGIKNHYAKEHEVPKLKKEIAEEIENIRCTSKSIHEVFSRLKTLWSSYGIHVELDDYPSTFNLHVKNTHAAPKGFETNFSQNPEIPLGYPGWHGRLQGDIKIDDDSPFKDNGCSFFSDLIGNQFFRDIPTAQYIYTGSGGGGKNFSYNSILFLYDFPEMHKAYKESGKEYKCLEVAYNRNTEKYLEDYTEKRDKFVKYAESTKQINKLREKAADLLDRCRQISLETEKYLCTEFSNKYEVPLPMPDSIYVDNERTKRAILTTQKGKGVPHPDFSEAIKYIEKLKKDIETYVEENPELML